MKIKFFDLAWIIISTCVTAPIRGQFVRRVVLDICQPPLALHRHPRHLQDTRCISAVGARGATPRPLNPAVASRKRPTENGVVFPREGELVRLLFLDLQVSRGKCNDLDCFRYKFNEFTGQKKFVF